MQKCPYPNFLSYLFNNMAFSSLNFLLIGENSSLLQFFHKTFQKILSFLFGEQLILFLRENSSLLQSTLDHALHLPSSAITVNLNLNDDSCVENVSKISPEFENNGTSMQNKAPLTSNCLMSLIHV